MVAPALGIDVKNLPKRHKPKPDKHDGLHSEHWCWCKCEKCWLQWKTTSGAIVGACICGTCPCPSQARNYLSSFRMSVRLGQAAPAVA